MILKRHDQPDGGKQRPRRKRAPLDLHLTVRFRFGGDPADTVTVMENRRVPMVDSVFRNRDRIVRNFLSLLVKTGLAQPKVARELFPLLRPRQRR